MWSLSSTELNSNWRDNIKESITCIINYYCDKGNTGDYMRHIYIKQHRIRVGKLWSTGQF